MAKSRLIGDYPVIGIRPTIDGRRGVLGVRESLEDQTMNMAKAAKKLFEENIRYSNGEPVKVIIADTTIGRVAEAAACADKFRKAGVDITLTVTPCWCYGAETMDMEKDTIKAVWGFNGTERPGAVYLASVLATHTQKGLPAFGIYGNDVCDADDTEIPEDVKEKLLRFGRAAVAAATMRGKSYLQIGSITMGIGGSIIDPHFLEDYLGMRVESVDEVEIIRRMTEGIYDEEEYRKALKWSEKYCHQGFDKNPAELQRTPEQKKEDWEFTVKMCVIIKDLMNGNRNLPAGCEEEAVGHNAIAAGFQGQRQWTDFYPNCDFPESILNTSFDWNGAREPYILATENDVLNGLSMLFMKLLTNLAQMFADVRTCWSAKSVKRVTGYSLEGHAAEADGIIHLINSGACCLDANGEAKDENGKLLEPMELAYVDVPDEFTGTVIDKLSQRKGNLLNMGSISGGYTRLEFDIPSRGLIGYRGEFMTDTKGNGIINTIFNGYAPYKGDIQYRKQGSLIAFEAGESVTYGLFNAQDRGTLFIGPGEKVYSGMVIGQSAKPEDIELNVCKKKHLTNTRSSSADEALTLTPPKILSLEQALEFIDTDELLEITPKSLRIRKKILDPTLRKRSQRN